MTGAELNKHNAKDRRDLHEVNSVRGTRLDAEEHVNESNVNECDLVSRKD